MRMIKQLIQKEKKVYIILRGKSIKYRFMSDAEREGVLYADGSLPTEKEVDDIVSLQPDGTLLFLGWAGRMQLNAIRNHAIFVDYEKYIAGEEEYFIKYSENNSNKEEDHMNDYWVESVEAIEWLREEYGDKIGSDLKSVRLCKDNEAVWVESRWTRQGKYGAIEKIVKNDLAVVAEPYEEVGEDGQMEYRIEPTFTPDQDIEDMFITLFSDEITLLNVTAVFELQHY